MTKQQQQQQQHTHVRIVNNFCLKHWKIFKI